MKNRGKKILLLLLAFISVAVLLSARPAIARAQSGGYVPLAPLPGTGNGCDPTTDSACPVSLGSYLSGIYKLAIAIAGVLAFLMIVIGGFTYLSTDALSGKEEGRHRIMNAAGGLILALASYIILYAINPNLVSLNLNFGPPAHSSTYKWQSPQVPNETPQAAFDRLTNDINQQITATDQNANSIRNSVASTTQLLQDNANGLLGTASLTQDQVSRAQQLINKANQDAQAVALYQDGLSFLALAQGNGLAQPDRAAEAAAVKGELTQRINGLISLGENTRAADLMQKANAAVGVICNQLPQQTVAYYGGSSQVTNTDAVNACITQNTIH